jgi:hypothetical protein
VSADNITTALITGGFMLVVIIFNEFVFLFRERRARKKDFFNQFFPERVKAHAEIARIMAEGGIIGPDPKTDSEIAVKKRIESICNAAHKAFAGNFLFADKHIGGMLLDIISEGSKAAKQGAVEPKLEHKDEFAEAVARFNSVYYKFCGALREKSGVEFIEDVFEGIPRKRDKKPKGKSGEDN